MEYILHKKSLLERWEQELYEGEVWMAGQVETVSVLLCESDIPKVGVVAGACRQLTNNNDTRTKASLPFLITKPVAILKKCMIKFSSP